MAAWDRLSRRYDRQLWLERSAARAAVDLLAPGADERVLDVGTGTGAILRQLEQRPRRPRDVVGIDASVAMLERVGELPSGWSLVVGDARRLPFADGAFDVALASYLLHVVADADLPVVLAELRRVLRPGGRLATITPAMPGRRRVRPLARALDRLAARRPERYGGLRTLDPRAALGAVGFTVVQSRRSVRGYPSLCVLAHRP